MTKYDWQYGKSNKTLAEMANSNQLTLIAVMVGLVLFLCIFTPKITTSETVSVDCDSVNLIWNQCFLNIYLGGYYQCLERVYPSCKVYNRFTGEPMLR